MRRFARFLDIPGGQEIVQESYAQLRKFNCWNISIVQQYARFKQSRIRSAVFGNSRQFFIMRQNDRANLDDKGNDIALPEVTQHAIMNYPLPDHQTGQKYSPFTSLHTDAKQQYWLYASMQKQRNNQVGSVRLYLVQLPEQRIDGVPFQPSTKLLRIEE